ncbi:hypothetical protein ES708_05790 [subsurface metagenome]
MKNVFPDAFLFGDPFREIAGEKLLPLIIVETGQVFLIPKVDKIAGRSGRHGKDLHEF